MTRFSPAVIVLLLLGGALVACQTPSSTPATATAPTAKAAEPTKVVDTSKPIDTEAARIMASNCFTCHGPNGRSSGTIPSLVNLSADDIAARLKNFKNGTTPSTVMGRHAKAYSDAEIDAMAAVIAGSKKQGAR